MIEREIHSVYFVRENSLLENVAKCRMNSNGLIKKKTLSKELSDDTLG
jgi:hypothetical protein